MSRERDTSGAGTVVAVGGLGVLLYVLLKNLGFGGEGRGEGRGELLSPAIPPSVPEAVSPRPKDDQRLTFVMTQPTSEAPYNLMSFRHDGKTYALGGMIDRVRAGGRSDVTLKIVGNVRAGSAEEALALVKQAGLEVWKEEGTAARVSGNTRGQYGYGA